MSVTAGIESSEGRSASPATNLRPKEHGAYAILAIPILTSLFVTGPTLVGICIAVAACSGFLAHEPLLVAAGRRGKRAQRHATTAKPWLSMLLGLTLVLGTVAFILGNQQIQFALVACGLLALGSFALAFVGQHKTLQGQLCGVIGLSAPCLPILLAGEIEVPLAVEVWTTWVIGFSATTVAVRGVIAAQKRQFRALHWGILSILSGLVLVTPFSTRFTIPIATLPMLAMSWYLTSNPPPAKFLKRVGWALVGGTVASAIWIIFII